MATDSASPAGGAASTVAGDESVEANVDTRTKVELNEPQSQSDSMTHENGHLDPTAAQAGGARSYSPSRPPTSAEIDAVIAQAMANAPPPPPASDPPPETTINRSVTPLMTNFLPASVGADGRVNLFVGNLPYRVRWQDLKDLFRKAGTVLRADVSLGPDNRSRGYGTVLMGGREDAARAIDRFNGYTWQTRTLEVRPDRLPPEYEAQPYSHMPNGGGQMRGAPMYTYHNMLGPGHAPFSLPGNATPSHGPPWLPGQLGPPGGGPGRPPPHSHSSHPSFSRNHPMTSGLALPPGAHPISLSPKPPHMALSASSPAMSGTSSNLAAPADGSVPPIGQSAEAAGLAASPLAGSLTTGPESAHLHPLEARRKSLTPFAHTHPADSNALSTNSSPALVPGPNLGSSSRPASSTGAGSGGKSGSTSPSKLEMAHSSSRAPPPGSLGPLPPSMFAGVKAVVSPGGSATSNGTSEGNAHAHGYHHGHSHQHGHVHPGVAPLPIAMEGLTHQGAHMGPPSTLHDRVVFVSNLPLHMQWQELKDLLRPAGIIIRADVATDMDGRPRGFGTALFATEKDAAKAVVMYNNREIGGQVIRVHLERDSHPEFRHGHDQSPLDSDPNSSEPRTSPSGALPWQINTSINGQNHGNGQTTPIRAGPGSGFPNNENTTPIHQSSYRPPHPGRLSMPPFRPLDSPGGLGGPGGMGAFGAHGPLSPPLPNRGLPPMTPSMPGFVFNAYPETPPLHPHFLSPGGGGPFSPGLPVTSSSGAATPGGSGFAFNPYYNAAPGAPVNRFPHGSNSGSGSGTGSQSGSAALGTPTTQAFPSGATRNFGSSGPPGAPGAGAPRRGGNNGGEYFPPIGSTMDPASPISSLSSRAAPSPSPLNARDRLSSTSASASKGPSPSPLGSSGMTTGDDLANAAADMSLNDSAGMNAGEDAQKTPVVSSSDQFPAPIGTEAHGQNGTSSGGGAANSRMSLEESRPRNLGVWDTLSGERRASFGDIVAGKRRS